MRKAMILIAASVLPLLEAQERGAPYASIIPRTKVYQSPNCGSMIPLKDGRIMWVWGVGGQRPQPYALPNANGRKDDIRRVVVGVLDELGVEHPLSRDTRRRLAAALY